MHRVDIELGSQFSSSIDSVSEISIDMTFVAFSGHRLTAQAPDHWTSRERLRGRSKARDLNKRSESESPEIRHEVKLRLDKGIEVGLPVIVEVLDGLSEIAALPRMTRFVQA
jgi:hypothetical protein